MIVGGYELHLYCDGDQLERKIFDAGFQAGLREGPLTKTTPEPNQP